MSDRALNLYVIRGQFYVLTNVSQLHVMSRVAICFLFLSFIFLSCALYGLPRFVCHLYASFASLVNYKVDISLSSS